MVPLDVPVGTQRQELAGVLFVDEIPFVSRVQDLAGADQGTLESYGWSLPTG